MITEDENNITTHSCNTGQPCRYGIVCDGTGPYEVPDLDKELPEHIRQKRTVSY